MRARVGSGLKLLIIDNQPVVISGCRASFSKNPSIRSIATGDETSGFRSFVKSEPDIVIVGVDPPDLSGLELIQKLIRHDSRAAIIAFGASSDPAVVLRAIEFGARGYVAKTDDLSVLVEAVEAVASRETFITPGLAKAAAFASVSRPAHPTSQLSMGENEVLSLLARGHGLQEIADMLGMSYKTIANTTSTMKRKMKARSHADLIRLAVQANH